MTTKTQHTPKIRVYEVESLSFPDLSLSEQIENGICDWCFEADGFEIAWGHNEAEARENGAAYLAKRGGYAHLSLDPDSPFAPIHSEASH